MFGRPGITYESAQTRKFKLGRTEVIRSASQESKEWAEAMLDPRKSSDPLHLRELFRKAVQRHIQYSTWAADGQGVDRHLFGLRKLVDQDRGEEIPELYRDEAFGKSSHWELSTSQLSSRYFDGWGYGEVVEDGYGLSYSIGDDYVRWTITSLKRRTGELKHYLAEAATEVRLMLEAAEKKERAVGQSKL
jgi:carnitine O-acetyltransferase